MQKENLLEEAINAIKKEGLAPLEVSNVYLSNLQFNFKDGRSTKLYFPALVCKAMDNPEQKFSIPLSGEQAIQIATSLLKAASKLQRGKSSWVPNWQHSPVVKQTKEEPQ